MEHLYDLLRRRAATFPGVVAVGGQQGLGWRTLTSAALLDLTDRLAAELAAAGVREGDRVLLWVPNGWRTPVYLFAIWKLGAVVVPFDREMNADAAARIIAAVSPRLILAGYGERPSWAPAQGVVDWWEPGSRQASAPADEWRPPTEELAAIVFTSGTTGVPKGCMLTHANLCSQVAALPERLPLDAGSRLASILPLSHLFELTCGLLYPLSQGAAIHYLPSRRGPDIVRVLKEQRVTHMLAVPQFLTLMGRTLDERLRERLPGPIYAALRRAAAPAPLPIRRRLYWLAHRQLGGCLRLLVSGGASLPPETQRLWEGFGVRVIQGYGATECSPVIAAGAADGSTPLGSVGTPIAGVTVRLGEGGELLVRGPNVFRGYWQDPERTAEVLRDGWYATGDLAAIDAKGNIRLVGRAKDLIVLPSGLNVWPQDVEGTLQAQPAVKDAAVVAVPTAAGGATLHAYLLPARAADAALLDRIVTRANGALAQHQRLASASWWPEEDFPRTALGKVRRQLLPLPDEAARRAVSVDATRAADDPVTAAIEAVAQRRGIAETETLAALGMDSLTLTELTLAVEAKTGIALADGALRTDMTVAEVRRTVSQIGAGVLPAAASTVVDEDGRPLARRAQVEAKAWLPPLWLYTWGRALRRLSWPLTLVHRAYVPAVHVLGAEHLRDLPPSVIFAPTHRSFADVPTLQRALREAGARPGWNHLVTAAAAGILADAGLAGRFVTVAFGLFPLRQYGEREASLRQLARVLAHGNSLVLFPQGRHTLPAEEAALAPQARFRPGVGRVALELGLPVVPVGLAGDERVVPGRVPPGFQGKVIAGIPVQLRRQPVAVAFGAPLAAEPGETSQAFTARIEAAAFALARTAEEQLDCDCNAGC